MKYFNKKNLISYIVIFSLLIILIITTLGGYLYKFYYDTIYLDFATMNESYISAIESRHENDLEVISDICVQINLSKNNTEFLLEKQPMKSIDLKSQLYMYLSVSNFFNQIFYFYQNDKYLYNDTTSVDINNFLKYGILMEKASAKELEETLYSKKSGLQIFPEQKIMGYLPTKADEYVGNIVSYFNIVEPKKDIMMMFTVSSVYYDELFNIKMDDIRQSMLIYENEVILTRGKLSSIAEKTKDTEFVKMILENKHSQFQQKIDSKNYIITKKTGKSGIVYCTIEPMSAYYDKIVSNQWGIFFLIIICLIPTSFIIVILSKEIYIGIKVINSMLNDDVKNYYDLENIEKGIRKLVDKNEEANEISAQLRKTKFVNAIVRGDYFDKESLQSASDFANININFKYFIVVLTCTTNKYNDNNSYNLMLNEVCNEGLVYGYGISLVIKNQNIFVLFSDSQEDITNTLEDMFLIGIKKYDNFIMSTSDFYRDLLETSSAYLEADTAFDNRFLVNNNNIIYYSNISKDKKDISISDTYIDRLKSAINSNDKERVSVIVAEIYENVQARKLSILNFRILYNNVISSLLKELDVDILEFENIYNIFTLLNCLTGDDFNSVLIDVCFNIINMKSFIEVKKSDIVLKAIDYMKENYNKSELNMSSLADYLGISGTQLAIEFKNSMGIKPSDYLVIQRIEKSKDLLINSNLKIKEISYLVGYEDDIVFNRRFKKFVGKTPGQFRLTAKE